MELAWETTAPFRSVVYSFAVLVCLGVLVVGVAQPLAVHQLSSGHRSHRYSRLIMLIFSWSPQSFIICFGRVNCCVSVFPVVLIRLPILRFVVPSSSFTAKA